MHQVRVFTKLKKFCMISNTAMMIDCESKIQLKYIKIYCHLSNRYLHYSIYIKNSLLKLSLGDDDDEWLMMMTLPLVLIDIACMR